MRDFLLQRNGLSKLQPDLKSNLAGLSQERLKQCCHRYIAIDISQHLPPNTPLPTASSEEAKALRMLVSEKFPFLEYAVHNMLNHADAAEGYGISQNGFLASFSLHTGSGLQVWITLRNLLERYGIRHYAPELSLLYILAEKNLPNLIRIQLERVPNIDIVGGRYGYPLYTALFNGNEKALRAILHAGISTSTHSVGHQNTQRTCDAPADHRETERYGISRIKRRAAENRKMGSPG